MSAIIHSATNTLSALLKIQQATNVFVLMVLRGMDFFAKASFSLNNEKKFTLSVQRIILILWSVQERCWSIYTPRYLVQVVCFISLWLIFTLKLQDWLTLLLISIYVFFESFKDNLLYLSHLSTFCSSLFTPFCRLAELAQDIVNNVSPAKSVGVKFDACGRSFTYKANSRGPSDEPWGP